MNGAKSSSAKPAVTCVCIDITDSMLEVRSERVTAVGRSPTPRCSLGCGTFSGRAPIKNVRWLLCAISETSSRMFIGSYKLYLRWRGECLCLPDAALSLFHEVLEASRRILSALAYVTGVVVLTRSYELLAMAGRLSSRDVEVPGNSYERCCATSALSEVILLSTS